jgi:hypothetical protein
VSNWFTDKRFLLYSFLLKLIKRPRLRTLLNLLLLKLPLSLLPLRNPPKLPRPNPLLRLNQRLPLTKLLRVRIRIMSCGRYAYEIAPVSKLLFYVLLEPKQEDATAAKRKSVFGFINKIKVSSLTIM